MLEQYQQMQLLAIGAANLPEQVAVSGVLLGAQMVGG